MLFEGLLNWLSAVGLHAIVPKEGAAKPFKQLSPSAKSERRQQLMSGSAIAAMTLMVGTQGVCLRSTWI